MNHDANIEKYWNILGLEAPENTEDHWIDENGDPISDEMFDEIAEYILGKLNSQNSQRILEIGCGTARILQKINELNPKVEKIGIDTSIEMIRIAKQRVNSAEFLHGDLLSINQERNKLGEFDLVFLHSVTQYFSSEEYFSEFLITALNILKPDGLLLLIDVPIDWYLSETRAKTLNRIIAKIKDKINRTFNLRKKYNIGSEITIELAGKLIQVPTFHGFFVSPETLIKNCFVNGYHVLMEYQRFPTKPLIYKKYRPIFIISRAINKQNL